MAQLYDDEFANHLTPVDYQAVICERLLIPNQVKTEPEEHALIGILSGADDDPKLMPVLHLVAAITTNTNTRISIVHLLMSFRIIV